MKVVNHSTGNII